MDSCVIYIDNIDKLEDSSINIQFNCVIFILGFYQQKEKEIYFRSLNFCY
jgi:hypothetical protein